MRHHKSPSGVANRAIVFNTDADSFHGYPEPIRCPPHRTRRSIALYYFTVDEAATAPAGSTDYRARPGDSLGRRLLIRLDTLAVAIFSRLKRRLGISDEAVGRWLQHVDRLRRRGGPQAAGESSGDEASQGDAASAEAEAR